jgi:predicted dehydrogenase
MHEFKLITLDPGHFHAALIQKEMYAGVSKRVAVYAPLGPDLIAHLGRIARFNLRADRPTCWELDVHAATAFVDRMRAEEPGGIVVLSGRNRAKIGYIRAALDAGMHVLADKPWIIQTAGLDALRDALQLARERDLVAYDVMTERYEITSMLQRELVNDTDVFGTIVSGSEDEPGVYMESVHHILKLVAGVPNLRPAWFFDIAEQGEALSDVGTHLVDLAQWTLFPESAIDWRRDIEMVRASRWPTPINAEQFRQVTGEAGEGLDYYCNTRVSYTLRGAHVKLDVLWRWEAPEGTGDTHLAIYRGTKARVEVRQGAAEQFHPELYVVPSDATARKAAHARIAEIATRYPGVAAEDRGAEIRVTIPDRFRVGHEAHFAQVTNRFFDFVRGEPLPDWENPNMLAKYLVSTRGVEMSQG